MSEDIGAWILCVALGVAVFCLGYAIGYFRVWEERQWANESVNNYYREMLRLNRMVERAKAQGFDPGTEPPQ